MQLRIRESIKAIRKKRRLKLLTNKDPQMKMTKGSRIQMYGNLLVSTWKLIKAMRSPLIFLYQIFFVFSNSQISYTFLEVNTRTPSLFDIWSQDVFV